MTQDLHALHQMALDLAYKANDAWLRLGNVLMVLHDTRFYNDLGHTSWDVYLGAEIGIPLGYAHRLVGIARWASINKLTQAQQKRLTRLGIAKAHCLTKVVLLRESFDEWADKATGVTVEDFKKHAYDATGHFDTKGKTFHIQQGAAEKRLERALKRARQQYQEPDTITQGELLDDIVKAYLGRSPS